MKLQDVRNFIEGNYLALKDKLSATEIPIYIKEQALYRAMLCSDCLKEGRCPECKCRTPNLFYSPKKVDSKKRWGAMLDEAAWELFKVDQKLELISDFKDILKDTMRDNVDLKHLDKASFNFRGDNIYHQMDPAFLVQLDSLFARCKEVTPQVLLSWVPERIEELAGLPQYYSKGRAVQIEIEDSYLHKFIKMAINMNFSVFLGEEYIHLDNREHPILGIIKN